MLVSLASLCLFLSLMGYLNKMFQETAEVIKEIWSYHPLFVVFVEKSSRSTIRGLCCVWTWKFWLPWDAINLPTNQRVLMCLLPESFLVSFTTTTRTALAQKQHSALRPANIGYMPLCFTGVVTRWHVVPIYCLYIPQQKLLSQVSAFVIYIYFRYIPHPQAGNGTIIFHAKDDVKR